MTGTACPGSFEPRARSGTAQLPSARDLAPSSTTQLPSARDFARLLDRFAPLSPVPLCPELLAFRARSLVEVWEAAERLAGHELASPFWAFPWAAGIALARVVLDRPEYVRGRSVLDIGAGGGITACACALAGAAEVVANDVDPWALAVTRLVADRQRLSVRTLATDLTYDPGAADSFDVIICADLAYDRSAARRERALLDRAGRRGALVLIADAERAYFDAIGLELLSEISMEVPDDLEGVPKRTARVYRLVRAVG